MGKSGKITFEGCRIHYLITCFMITSFTYNTENYSKNCKCSQVYYRPPGKGLLPKNITASESKFVQGSIINLISMLELSIISRELELIKNSSLTEFFLSFSIVKVTVFSHSFCTISSVMFETGGCVCKMQLEERSENIGGIWYEIAEGP